LNGPHDHVIHSFKECVPEGSDYLQQTLGRANKRRISTHDKRREYRSNWRSSSHDSENGLILQEPLIHIRIWIRNYHVMNEEDDEVEGSRRSLHMKQIKMSIRFSFHDIVWLCICLYLVDVLCMFEYLHLYYWILHWVWSQCCCTTFYYYLSILKSICWNIRSITHS